MKKYLSIIVFIICINLSFAQDKIYQIGSAEINTKISSEVAISPVSADYSIKEVEVNLSFVPIGSLNQEILSMEMEPNAEKIGDSMIFRWETPSQKISFILDANIKVNNNLVKVKNKVIFPLDKVPDDIIVYTSPSMTIDSSDENIIKKASELVQGEDDSYVALFKLADWAKNNVKYDLSTLTVEASQKASWVLEQREGVCDEITSLFIAFCRSLGIPARFISGAAYTNLNDEFGSHGWAEVWLPEYGWIPFDVTFGEFGFINPLHIKMQESFDSAEPSTNYKWTGRNVKLDTRPLDIKTIIINKKESLHADVSLHINPLKKEAGFGSYNLVEAEVENLNGYYTATELYLVRPKEVKIEGAERQQILLKPGQKKKVYWIVQIDRSLNPNFVYTFPLVLYAMKNESAESEIRSGRDSPLYSLDEIQDSLKETAEEEKKAYSKDLALDCTSTKDEIYEYEKSIVNCSIKNKGNIMLNDLKVCLEEECGNINLGISQEKNVVFSAAFKEGSNELKITAENKDVSKAKYLNVRSLDLPKIEIVNPIYPEVVEYNNKFDVSFEIEKKSSSNPVDISVFFDQGAFKKEWSISELYSTQKIILSLQAKDLSSDENTIKITVKYKDKHGAGYTTERSFQMRLENLSMPQKARILLNRLAHRIEEMNSANFVNMLVAITIVFAGVIAITLAKRRKRQ